jgi:hypothetical protein
MVSSTDDNEMGLQQLAKVLTSLGYNEMVAAATILANLPSVVGWIRFSHPFGTMRWHQR